MEIDAATRAAARSAGRRRTGLLSGRPNVIFGAVERMIAFRYLRARRQEGFVSVIAVFSLLGIALGVATLIIVMSVMNGFRADLLARILGLNGDLGVYAAAGPLGDFGAAARKVASVRGVTAAVPVVEGQVMATTDFGASGALVRGIRPADLRALRLVSGHIVQGSLADFGDDGVAIGDRLAQRLGVTVGAPVTVIAPQGTATAFGTMPRIKTYRVVALFDVGMYEYDNSFLYVPLGAAQLFFEVPQAVTALQVFLADPDRVGEASKRVAAALHRPVRIVDWQQANSSLFNAVEIERNVMFLILTLIIVVAAFNIVSSMIMMVKDKGRDIAILRTMGASRGMVMRIFMLSGASVGVFGTVAGLALGIVITRNLEAIRQFLQNMLHVDLFSAEIYFFTRIPARIDGHEVAAVVVMALALSFLATLYPSWRAARLDPVEALRYE
jgi:lipoprotein-releasing system permease protein